MLTLINETPHEARLVRLILDAERCAAVVVVKSTYDIAAGRATLAGRQRTVLMSPQVEEGVELEPEGVLGKAAVDVLAVGSAAGDGRTRVTYVSVGMGGWSSTLMVSGERRWRRSMLRWCATEPEPFASLPVSWATAFGGLLHSGNPAGKGYVVSVDASVEGRELPNVEDPHDRVEQPGQSVTPLCFAPMSVSSGLRIEAALDDSKLAGVGKALFNVAHPRHRLAQLHGGERCELRGWAGMGAEIFELPADAFVLEVAIADRRHEFHPRIDTVCLWPSKQQLVVTQRATFTYHYLRGKARSARLRVLGEPRHV